MDNRPKITDLFKQGSATTKLNAKQQRLFQSLQWRQAYQTSDVYEYKLEDNSTTIKLHQILNGEMKGLGTGTFVWPAAHILAKYLEIHAAEFDFSNKRVCDIGSGTGLTGIVAAALGAGEVLLSDQACIAPIMEQNVHDYLQLVSTSASLPRSSSIFIKEYDWCTLNAISEEIFDILLISDCVLPKLYPIDLLIQAVYHLMSDHTVAHFSYEHRPYPAFDPRQEFHRLISQPPYAKDELVLEVIPFAEHHPIYSSEDIEIWRLTKRSSAATTATATAGTAGSISQPLQLLSWGQDRSEVQVKIYETVYSFHQDSQQGIGGILWPSSAIAAKLILGNHPLLQAHLPATSSSSGGVGTVNQVSNGKSEAIDLGAGCRLTTLALHLQGFSRVIATDKLAIVEGVLQQNTNLIKQHGAAVTSEDDIVLQVFDWEQQQRVNKLSASAEESESMFVVCSDCLYSTASVGCLLQVLDQLASHACQQCSNSNNGSLHILLVNELRSALEEFHYLARRREQYSVDIQEISLLQPDLELIRSAQEMTFAPLLRAMLMTWSARSEGEDKKGKKDNGVSR